MSNELTENNDRLIMWIVGFTLGCLAGMFVGAALRYAAELLFRVVTSLSDAAYSRPDRQG